MRLLLYLATLVTLVTLGEGCKNQTNCNTGTFSGFHAAFYSTKNPTLYPPLRYFEVTNGQRVFTSTAVLKSDYFSPFSAIAVAFTFPDLKDKPSGKLVTECSVLCFGHQYNMNTYAYTSSHILFDNGTKVMFPETKSSDLTEQTSSGWSHACGIGSQGKQNCHPNINARNESYKGFYWGWVGCWSGAPRCPL